MDMSAFVVPKSDQLNADDLIAGPRTIRITRVSGSGNPEQPVNVYFDEDGGKPFRPCKSMRRVMIEAWGPDAAKYPGRLMTLYRDPKVAFGGMQVGGIRISHMSHIAREMVMALTVTKAKRAPFTVKPLRADAEPAQGGPDKATSGVATLIDRVRAAPDVDALRAITAEQTVIDQREWLAKKRPELAAQVDDAVQAALDDLADRSAIQSEGEPA